MSQEYITCKQLIDFLGEYLEGGLTPEQRTEFDRHLAVCPACVDYLKTYRETIRLTRSSFEATAEPPPRSVPEDLVRAIMAAVKKKS